MRLTCPYCNFSKDIPRERIPVGVRHANCPRCGQKFAFLLPESHGAVQMVETSPGPAAGDSGVPPGGQPRRNGAPWERRSEIGLWQGIFQTFKSVSFSPQALFSGLAYGSGLREPMAFGLLFGSLGSMFGFFWKFLIAAAGILGLEGVLGLEGYLGASVFGPFTPAVFFVVAMALVSLFVIAGMFIYAGVLHLFLLLVRGGNSGFEATYRVVAYSQAAQIWGVIPFVGGWIGGVWQLIVQAIGLREIHGTSYVRVFLAFLIPAAGVVLVVIALVALVFYVLFQSGAGRQFF